MVMRLEISIRSTPQTKFCSECSYVKNLHNSRSSGLSVPHSEEENLLLFMQRRVLRFYIKSHRLVLPQRRFFVKFSSLDNFCLFLAILHLGTFSLFIYDRSIFQTNQFNYCAKFIINER